MLKLCRVGTTPAYFCAQEGHLDCFKYLCIEVYADKLSRAGDGMTTLHGATQGGHFETVKASIHCLFVCLLLVSLFVCLFVCLSFIYMIIFVILLLFMFTYQ